MYSAGARRASQRTGRSSLRIAASDPASFDGLKADEFEKRMEQIESSSRGFASLIAQPTDNFQIGVGEALLFSNGDRVLKEYPASFAALGRGYVVGPVSIGLCILLVLAVIAAVLGALAGALLAVLAAIVLGAVGLVPTGVSVGGLALGAGIAIAVSIITHNVR